MELLDPRTRERGTLGTTVQDPFLAGAGGDGERLLVPEDSSDKVGWAVAGLDAACSCSVLGASGGDSSSSPASNNNGSREAIPKVPLSRVLGSTRSIAKPEECV